MLMVLVEGSLLATSVGVVRAADPAAVGTRPLVLAYYYIWYSTISWDRAKTDLPTLAAYDSADRTIVAQHLAWLRRAGIDGLIVSWKHEERLDVALEVVVDEATKAGIKLVLLYQGLDFDRLPIDADRIGADVNWFLDSYGASGAFDVFGRPTVVWSGTWKFTDQQIERVRSTIGAPARVLLLGSEKSAETYAARGSLLDGDAYYWSSPDPLSTPGYAERLGALGGAVRSDRGIWIAPAAPGFDARLVGGMSVVPRRDGTTYRAAWDGALATDPDAIGIISWNEFSENSHIEPSRDHGDSYLNLTAELSRALPPRSLGAVPGPTMVSTPAPGEDLLDAADRDRSSMSWGGTVAGFILGIVAIVFAVNLRRRQSS